MEQKCRRNPLKRAPPVIAVRNPQRARFVEGTKRRIGASMSTEAKTPQIFFYGWAALLTRAIGSGFLHLGQRLNAIILWARAMVVAIEWNAMLERQRAKKVAREKEARLARQLSELTEAVVLLDDKHRLVKANQNALCLL